MGEITLTAKSPLGGRQTEIAGCVLREVAGLALTSLAVPLGGDAAFDKMLEKQFGMARPSPVLSAVKGSARALSLTPDQLLVLHDEADGAAQYDAAYATDQTGNWVVLELRGENATEALRRICPLDLDESVFPVDSAARTVMEHLGALIIRTAPQTYLLLSASSSARSFWHAVETSLRNVA